MQVAIVRATFDRKTGQKIGEGIVGYEEVSEDEYYRPLIEIMTPRFMEWLREQEGTEYNEQISDQRRCPDRGNDRTGYRVAGISESQKEAR